MLRPWRSPWSYDSITSQSSHKEDNWEDEPGLRQGSIDNEAAPGSLQSHTRPENKKRLACIQGLPWIIVMAETIVIAIIAIYAFVPDGELIKTSGSVFDAMNDTTSSPTEINMCGNSSAEARQKGCTFDQLNWSWLPPSCPPYANDLFIHAENPGWRYFEALEGRNLVDGEKWDEVLNGDRRVFVEREHLSHCVFRFLSIAQILRDGTPYHAKLADYRHSAHCANAVLESMRRDPEWFKIDTYSGIVSFRENCEEYR